MKQKGKTTKSETGFVHIFLLIVVLVGVVGGVITYGSLKSRKDGKEIKVSEELDNLKNKEKNFIKGDFPQCPENLSGILTYPLMEPKYISALTPLGNINPPGHTSPVDHVYFETDYEGQIPLYAPSDAWITNITTVSVDVGDGSYKETGYVIQYTICSGLVLDFASYTDIIQPLKDELAKQKPDCKYGIKKDGHDNAGEGQCYYQDLKYRVKSGEKIGWVQRVKRPEGGYNFPFEIWAANYNQDVPIQTDWSFYDDDRYAHIICPFDLYSGELKKQFESKFGFSDPKVGKFTPRTVEPVCGQVDQDITGTIQGMWFSQKPNLKDKSGNVYSSGQGIAFLHNNIDPTQGEVSIGGEFDDNLIGVIGFTPSHSGTVNREPSEVKKDGHIYCYSQDNQGGLPVGWNITGKVLVQLVDDHHIKAEHQQGFCGDNESFQQSFTFER